VPYYTSWHGRWRSADTRLARVRALDNCHGDTSDCSPRRIIPWCISRRVHRKVLHRIGRVLIKIVRSIDLFIKKIFSHFNQRGGRFDDIGASARFVFGFAQDCDRQDQHRIAVWDLLSPNQPPIARMTLPEKAVVNVRFVFEP